MVPEAATNKSYRYKSNVQLDSEIESDPICSSAGCESKAAAKTHPMDYFVPNFGADHDIMHSDSSLNWAQNQLNHKWVVSTAKPPPGHPTDYFVPDFGMDEDVKSTLNTISQ